MSEPLLNVMKIMLLAGLYLFFVRVLWSVYNELRDPRTVARRTPRAGAANAQPTPNPPPSTPMRVPGTRIAGAAAATMAPPAPMVGQLIVLEPPQLAGLTWALGNEITLGRLPSCGIHLDDTYVSGVHARIFAIEGAFMIEDLDSRNGTLLNGEPLTATTGLRAGDVIALGATAMEFS